MASGMITPVYDTEADRIKDQLATAAALRNKAIMGGNDNGAGMHGRVYMVGGGPLGQIAQALGGAYMDSKAREAQGAMEQRQGQERADFLAAMPGGQETVPQFGPGEDGGSLPDVERQMNPRALAQATQQWAANAPRGMEGVQNFALQQALTAPQRQAEQEFRATEASRLAAERADAAKLMQSERIQAQAERAQEANALRMTLAQMAAANRPAPAPHTQIAYGQDGKGYMVDMRTGAQTPLENIGKMPAAGGVGGKLPVQAQKVQGSLQNLESGLNAYETLLKDYNPQNADALTPAKRAAIGTAFTDLQMRLKEAYELGAITGPDMSVLQSAITDPTSAWGMLKGGIAGRDTFNAQIGQSKAALNRQKRNFEQQFGVMLPTPAGTATEPMPGAAAAPSEFKVLKVRDK